ncbi:polysaccharide deacetylase [Georgenia satyanarayanai]|uniref:polysaccharide deacetylase family protein n=1 Tax=Georgenia satyanarayanai TaxID=860221 RepID=UPI0020415DC4|nr:polysaccharide deacetylase [Georgenia satyanarayanai]MCM3662229.1 polysaccharide deacetylase [Georgenia satyanarayanai]
MAKDIKVCIGVHVDAVAGWLGSYGGQDSPNDIQRGMFAGEVGVPRLRRMLQQRELPATWFVPGHSVETFPKEIGDLVSAGFELGCHGYSHENPVAMSAQQEADVLGRSVELVKDLTGSGPRGYVAPWWEMSEQTAQLLLNHGFSYDNSQSYDDFTPFYARVGDSWTHVDYTKPAAEWMKPLVRGHEVDLVEIAANWYVDDLPPMMFIKGNANSHGFVAPQVIEQLWKDQFDWIYREMDYAVFPFTIHPDVSGRPQVLLMLERIFDYIGGHDGVEWLTFDEVATDFRRRMPFGS